MWTWTKESVVLVLVVTAAAALGAPQGKAADADDFGEDIGKVEKPSIILPTVASDEATLRSKDEAFLTVVTPTTSDQPIRVSHVPTANKAKAISSSVSHSVSVISVKVTSSSSSSSSSNEDEAAVATIHQPKSTTTLSTRSGVGAKTGLINGSEQKQSALPNCLGSACPGQQNLSGNPGQSAVQNSKVANQSEQSWGSSDEKGAKSDDGIGPSSLFGRGHVVEADQNKKGLVLEPPIVSREPKAIGKVSSNSTTTPSSTSTTVVEAETEAERKMTTNAPSTSSSTLESQVKHEVVQQHQQEPHLEDERKVPNKTEQQKEAESFQEKLKPGKNEATTTVARPTTTTTTSTTSAPTSTPPRTSSSSLSVPAPTSQMYPHPQIETANDTESNHVKDEVDDLYAEYDVNQEYHQMVAVGQDDHDEAVAFDSIKGQAVEVVSRRRSIELYEEGMTELREPEGNLSDSGLDTQIIIGIIVGSLMLIIIGMAGIGFVLYREKRQNQPRTLEDSYAQSDSCFSDDIASRRYSHGECSTIDLTMSDPFNDDMTNLDNDSFLNSLEVLAVPANHGFRQHESDV